VPWDGPDKPRQPKPAPFVTPAPPARMRVEGRRVGSLLVLQASGLRALQGPRRTGLHNSMNRKSLWRSPPGERWCHF
jgi:hypothetical protein